MDFSNMSGYSSSFQINPNINLVTGAYQSALADSNNTYQNILSGYASTAAQQRIAQQSIAAGYGQLQGNVLGEIQGIDASQRQAIKDAYVQQQGTSSQKLISSGLGNTTVTSAVNRGLQFDKQKADIALSNQTAQLRAGYMSNLGLAGLNYRNQANVQNSSLYGQQAGLMGMGAGQRAGLAGAYMGDLTGMLGRGGGQGGGGGGRGMGQLPTLGEPMSGGIGAYGPAQSIYERPQSSYMGGYGVGSFGGGYGGGFGGGGGGGGAPPPAHVQYTGLAALAMGGGSQHEEGGGGGYGDPTEEDWANYDY